jgi:hypothetical protein
MKTCNHCRLDKELCEFGKDRTSRDGVNPKCRLCCQEFQRKRRLEKSRYDRDYRERNRDRLRLRDRERAARRTDWRKDYRLQRVFGISLAQYELKLAEQGGVCAVCGKPEWVVGQAERVKRLAVDHDHKTGKIRGLLCNNCNRALGMLYDDVSLVLNMAAYLRRYGK